MASDHHGLAPPIDSRAADCAEAAADDADDPAVGIAGEQREASGELDHPEDDQDPAHRVEVGEDVPRVVHEDVRAVQRADAVDDVERSRDQQQNRCECGSTRTSHLVPPWLIRSRVRALPATGFSVQCPAGARWSRGCGVRSRSAARSCRRTAAAGCRGAGSRTSPCRGWSGPSCAPFLPAPAGPK